MIDRSFEKQIADKMNRAEVQPSEGMLESIFEKRASRPKRFAGIGYSGLVLAVIAVSVAAFSFILWNGTGKIQEEMAMESNRNIPESNPSHPNTELADVKENKPTSQADELNQKPAQLNLSGNQTLAENKVKDRDKKQSAKAITIAKADKNTSNTAVNPPANQPSYTENQTYNINPDLYFNVDAVGRPVIAKEQHKGNSHLYVYQTIGDKEIADRGFLFSRLCRMEKMPHRFTDEEISMTPSPLTKTKDKTPIQRNPVFVDALFSPSLTMIGSYGSSDLQKVNNALARSSYNSQYGIRVSVPVSKQFSVFSGAFYRKQSNVYKGELLYQTNETRVDQNIRYINDPVLGVIQVVTNDTVSYTASRKQEINHRNTYSILQLPLGLSYNYGYRKFDFAFHASALINVFRNSNGQALNLESHQTNAFESKTTFVGLGAGFSWMSAYKISPKFRLIFEPGIQYLGINSVKAGNNVKENAIIPQLSLGLRYTIF